MYCKHCGKEIDNDSSFCKHCGKTQGTISVLSDAVVYKVIKAILFDTKWFAYSIWLLLNLYCLSGEKSGNEYNRLFPRFADKDEFFSLYNYLFTDFFVYAVLIPAALFLGCHYFKSHKSTITRLIWVLWFVTHFMMYIISDYSKSDFFFPFTLSSMYMYELIVTNPLFDYHAYDLSELVVYTMLIPIGYWGYLYYRNRKVQK